MDPISDVSHMILARVSTRVFACNISCYRYTRKSKTVGGLNIGPLTLHVSGLPY